MMIYRISNSLLSMDHHLILDIGSLRSCQGVANIHLFNQIFSNNTIIHFNLICQFILLHNPYI